VGFGVGYLLGWTFGFVGTGGAGLGDGAMDCMATGEAGGVGGSNCAVITCASSVACKGS
jgi:hypothetical protein